MGNVRSSYAAHNQDPQASPPLNSARANMESSGVHVINVAGRVQNDHLGGLRADLASLLAFPYRTNFPPPSIHATTTVKANVNLNKDSLQLIRDEDAQYRIKFIYDAYTPCIVRLYFAAKETSPGVIQARSETPSVSVEKGFGVTFSQQLGHFFDISSYNADELTATATSTVFPIIIIMQSLSADNELAKPLILSQTTFTTLLQCADNTYAIKVVKQRLPYLGHSYNLHDIFGLDYTGERENEGSRECVVCLSEPRDTTILPCNHMCLCAACAELMRTQTNKCPICRAPVKKLLSIHSSPSAVEHSPIQSDVVDDCDEKEDELLPRREINFKYG